MKTYLVEYRDQQGYKKKDLFSEPSKDILIGKLKQQGITVLDCERYA